VSEPRGNDEDDATRVESYRPPAPEGASVPEAHEGTTLAGRYDLLGFLGSGGMGTVYHARDRELDELVAIKVLKRDIAQSPRDLERFRREVKLARKVTHRNVVRTFDIGHDGTDRFLTMEYVEGSPLSALLHSNARWPADRVVALATELCDGLRASHDAGVLHGDLKPQNVIMRRGERPVITDFGIARALVQGSEGDDESTEGTLIGTPTYMAPEQVEGARDLDARADVYALGCMLFRALTGYAPWKGSSAVATAVMRLVHPPPDARTVVADVPAPLAEAVLRCMARARDARFASMDALLDALRAITPTAVTSAPTSPAASSSEPSASSVADRPALVGAGGRASRAVAVLAIGDDGADESAYLARAVGDEVVELLAVVPRLRVVAGRAPPNDSELGARDAGRALGADVVISGDLTRAGDLVRVTLRAVTVEDGFRLWTHAFSSPVAEIVLRTRDAAASVAKIFVPDDIAIAMRALPDAAALDLYLRGRHLYATSYFDTDGAIAALGEAHRRAPSDGRIAAAYGLALMRKNMLDASSRADTDLAQRLAHGALERVPGLAAAHVILALVHYDEGEHRSTAVELRKALESEPGNPDALDLLGNLLLEGGRPTQAIEMLRMASAADPARETIDATLARAYELLGDSQTADELLGGLQPPTRDVTRVWLSRARFTLWRHDVVAAERWLANLATFPSSIARSRAERYLQLVRTGVDAPEPGDADADVLSPIARRAAFVAQVKIELFLARHEVAKAEERLGELMTYPFFDLTWLDRCPLLAPLRQTMTFAVLRRATAARVERALEAL
jgi:TolB-like protein/Tfp pilus assembly protein PilF/predicted Ser/Thr protein kinase